MSDMYRLFKNMMLILLVMTANAVKAEVLPDPTRPPDYQDTVFMQDLPQEMIDWRVTAIRLSDMDRTAIINGIIVREGETVGTAKVIEIQPIHVILEYNGRKAAVRLFSDMAVRKPSGVAESTESVTP